MSNEYTTNPAPSVAVGHDGTVYLGIFVPLDGSDYVVPVENGQVDGDPHSFVEVMVSRGYAEQLTALLVEKLGVPARDLTLESRMQRPSGPGDVSGRIDDFDGSSIRDVEPNRPR